MKQNELEIGRVACLFAVVFIHVNANGFFSATPMTGYFIDELARFAVPVFFLLSGYLWKPVVFSEPSQYFVKLFTKLAPPMIFWTAVYNIVNTAGYLPGEPFHLNLLTTLAVPLIGGAGFHLWFIPALFIGAVVTILGVKLLGELRFAVVALALYGIGILLGAYQHFLGMHIQNLFYRNGLSFAPIFLLAGFLIKKYELRVDLLYAIPVLIGGFLIHFAEGYYLTERFPGGHDFSVGTLLFAVGTFFVILNIRKPNAFIASFGDDVFGAYLIHLLILRYILQFSGTAGPPLAFAAGILTFVASLLLSRMMRHNRFSRVFA